LVPWCLGGSTGSCGHEDRLKKSKRGVKYFHARRTRAPNPPLRHGLFLRCGPHARRSEPRRQTGRGGWRPVGTGCRGGSQLRSPEVRHSLGDAGGTRSAAVPGHDLPTPGFHSIPSRVTADLRDLPQLHASHPAPVAGRGLSRCQRAPPRVRECNGARRRHPPARAVRAPAHRQHRGRSEQAGREDRLGLRQARRSHGRAPSRGGQVSRSPTSSPPLRDWPGRRTVPS
jgi:hypothetical protein